MQEQQGPSGKRHAPKPRQDQDTLSMPQTSELTGTKVLAIDILVKGGWVDAVEKMTKEYKIPAGKADLLIGESLIACAIDQMLEEAEGGIDPDRITPLLDRKEAKAFLSHTTDPEILEALVSALIEGTHAQMEEYAQITALGVLGDESVGAALKRNESIPKVRKALEKLVREGLRLVFSGHYIEPEMVEEYFPVVNGWKHLIDANKFVAEYLDSLKDGDRFDDLEEKDDVDQDDPLSVFLSDATHLKKLLELTDRATVSKLIQDMFPDSASYSKLVDKNLLEPASKARRSRKVTGIPSDIAKALVKYEHGYSPDWNVKDLAEKIGNRGKDILSKKLGEWVGQGMCEHVKAVLEFKDGELIDRAKAKQEIAQALAELIKDKNSKLLKEALIIPEEFIDDAAVELAPILLARRALRQEDEPIMADPIPKRDSIEIKKGSPLQSKKGSRYFVPSSLAEFKDKLTKAIGVSPSEDVPLSCGHQVLNLSTAVAKDLSKVHYANENIYWKKGVGPLQSLRGFHRLDNGLSFFGLEVHGDGEVPVFMIIYWDGKTFRGYIPKDGNMWNTDTNTAYGNDSGSDRINLQKRFPEHAQVLLSKEISIESIEVWQDAKKIVEDIKGRIVTR